MTGWFKVRLSVHDVGFFVCVVAGRVTMLELGYVCMIPFGSLWSEECEKLKQLGWLVEAL